jgi:hypothetical protein
MIRISVLRSGVKVLACAKQCTVPVIELPCGLVVRVVLMARFVFDAQLSLIYGVLCGSTVVDSGRGQ